jgi:uncharacterized repeat protein (TIGR01451 family)
MSSTKMLSSLVKASLSCCLAILVGGCSYSDQYAWRPDQQENVGQQQIQQEQRPAHDDYAVRNTDRAQLASDRRADAATDTARPNRANANAGAGATRNVLAFPTGDQKSSVVQLEAIAPEQVRVGQSYTYTLKVTNLTDAPLHGVVVRDLAAAPPTTRPAGQHAANNADLNSDDQAQLAGHQMSATAASDTANGPAGGWSIGTLGPKQTVTQQFTATAEEVGAIRNCLSVSYQPTLCMAVNVVRPEIQVGKEGPSDVMICQDIPYVYTITNTGTGTAQALRIEDQLPEGLTTADGGKVFAADVGNLGQGESKRVTARLRATRTGQFTSHAFARGSGMEAQSKDVSTTVRAPVLALNVDAPAERFVGEPIDYKVTVKNTGDAPAQQTVVRLTGADGQRLADRQVGTIAPGESKNFPVSVRTGRQGGTVHTQAVAEAECANRVTTESTVAVKTVPALRMECVDTSDPVRVGNDTTYTISVKNQGSGPDSNIIVHATLPPELQFVSADGASKVSASGQELTFAPVATLNAGETAQWTVEVRALKAADVKFVVDMKSDSLGNQAAIETEPTRLLQ